jgi:4-hydroxybenzoate polyprenyltransferase
MTEPAAAPKSSGKLGLTLAIAIVLVICAAVALIRPVLLTYVAGISLPLAIIYAFETARPRLMAACCTTIGAALSAPVVLAGLLHHDWPVHTELLSWAAPLGGIAVAAGVAALLPWLFGRTKQAEQNAALDRMAARADELRGVWGDRLDRPAPR